MKIAILNFRNISSAAHGGAEVYLEKIAMEWIKMGHNVTFFSPKTKVRTLSHRNPAINYKEIGNFLTVYGKAPRYVKQEEWDLVVDCINVRGFNVSKWISSVKGSPKHFALIFQTAEEVWNAMLPFPFSFFGRRILEPYWLFKYRKTPVFTICESSAISLKKYGIHNAKVINPGFDFDIKNPPKKSFNIDSNSKTISIVFCARLVAMKRPSHALKTLEILASVDKSRDYILHIIGDGKLRTSLEESSLSRNLNVQFHGKISEAKRNYLYKNSEFLIATSVREGWGLTVSEAAYHGALPVVYDVPGLKDSSRIVGGVTVSESAESIAFRIIELLDNKEKHENLSMNQPKKQHVLKYFSEKYDRNSKP